MHATIPIRTDESGWWYTKDVKLAPKEGQAILANLYVKSVTYVGNSRNSTNPMEDNIIVVISGRYITLTLTLKLTCTHPHTDEEQNNSSPKKKRRRSAAPKKMRLRQLTQRLKQITAAIDAYPQKPVENNATVIVSAAAASVVASTVVPAPVVASATKVCRTRYIFVYPRYNHWVYTV